MADNPLSMSLKARVKILEQENTELKRHIQSLSKLIPDDKFIDVSDEQFICEMEIRRLRDIALSRPLNLEETKKLDILMKNLKDVRNEKKEQVIEVKKNMDISLDQLMSIASNKNEKEQDGTSSETGSDS
jgi:hypothetical protein